MAFPISGLRAVSRGELTQNMDMPVSLPILSCNGCSLCCGLQPHPPFLPQELDRLPIALARSVEALVLAEYDESKKGPCIWLDDKGLCKHYDHRPSVCREFEMGGEECILLRQEHGK